MPAILGFSKSVFNPLETIQNCILEEQYNSSFIYEKYLEKISSFLKAKTQMSHIGYFAV